MTKIKGICHEKFIKVREVLEKNLENGADIGASVAVFIDGEAVVDVWGGSGGSIAFNDLDSRMTVAYVMNKHVEDSSGFGPRGIEIVCAVYDSLNVVNSKSVSK